MKTMRIIYLHGISDKIIDYDYTAVITANITARLKELNIIPLNATPEEVDQIVTFDSINYSAVGQPQEDIVLNTYKKESGEMYNFFDLILENLAFGEVRRQMITSVSDALIYESDFWRDQIRNILLDKINTYVGTGEEVTVIGHSLGSVIAFDVIYYNNRHNPLWIKNHFKPKNFFTLGSPIALFSLEMDSNNGKQKPRYIPMNKMTKEMDPRNTNPDLDITLEKGVWYNFFDAQDVIAYPLQVLFQDKFRVKDILIQTGTNPINAHKSYWNSKEVANTIAQKLIEPDLLIDLF